MEIIVDVPWLAFACDSSEMIE
ncbi:hypothetical protein CCACVL1_29091, partial [Corchorus capsularis]